MPPVFVTTADAVDRETAWLTTSGDGLPALLVGDGGKWDLIQAYQPRTPAQRKNQIWVMRRRLLMTRYGMVRKMPKYAFRLRCWWTLSNSAGTAESDQRAFDLAIDDLVARINGFGPAGSPVEPGASNKTHGGRFLSVAEDSGDVDVQFTDPDTTLMPSAAFAAEVTYMADDPDFDM
jgi:hypothetical protein